MAERPDTNRRELLLVLLAALGLVTAPRSISWPPDRPYSSPSIRVPIK